MNNIAIVGVEGSGKTVLMAAMGDKYKSPDANGIFLKPVNRETFAYCEKLMGQMQDGKWPMATGKDITDNLRWTLTKKIADGDDDKIAELSFLDFGGEIYRLAFGGGVHEEPDEDTRNAIEQLRSHVEEAEVLIVLVNLSDIINGKRDEERTIEMNWLSQAILSFAYDEANKSSVALVFTQADSYAETIADCGGLRGVLTRYMPTVDTSYGKRLALFSVAAVNKTIPAPDGSGFQVPSPDFKPQGLENLVSWVVNYVVEVRRRKKQRVAKAIEEEENKRKRWKMAVGVIGLLGILGLGSWIGYNVNAEFKNFIDGRLTAWGLMRQEATATSESHSDVVPAKPVEVQTDVVSAVTKPPTAIPDPPKPKPRWIVGARNPNNPNLVAGEDRDTWAATRPGYVWVKGTDRDEWKQGLLHPENFKLVSDWKEGTWKSTQPGYVWVKGTDRDEWKQGLRHPDNSRLVSDWKEGDWKSTEEGYVWVGGSQTEWRAGIESSKHPHWVSIITDEHPTDYWRPKPGYSKKDKNAEGLSELVWTPGLMDGGRKAAATPGHWLRKCSSCGGRGKKDCWKCDGGGRINCTNCSGSGRVETTESERCWKCNGTGELEQPCPRMDCELNFTFGHVFQGKHVFRCRNCWGMGGYGFVICPACSGLGFELCSTCNGNNKVRVDCNNCDNGSCTRQTMKNCSDCSGRGTVICPRSECHSGKVSCSSCNGDGWIAE